MTRANQAKLLAVSGGCNAFEKTGEFLFGDLIAGF
jgi:hypothetical protein